MTCRVTRNPDLTLRENILAQFKIYLDELSDFAVVENRRPTIPDIEKATFPCAFVYPGPENRIHDARAVMGYETWEWNIVIEVWCYENALEHLLGRIHYKLYEEYEVGGLAVSIERDGVDIWTIDPEQTWYAMTIPYSVLYRHPVGVM